MTEINYRNIAFLLKSLVAIHPAIDLKMALSQLEHFEENVEGFCKRFLRKATLVTISSDEDVDMADDAEMQRCFDVAVRNYSAYPGRYRLFAGFSATKSEDDYGGWYLHFWLQEKETGKIVEPTRLTRRLYYGFKVPKKAIDAYMPLYGSKEKPND